MPSLKPKDLTTSYDFFLEWEGKSPNLKVKLELGDLVSVQEALMLGLTHFQMEVKYTQK